MAAEKPGRVAIITAGGSGMGAGAARRLAADGFKVAILSSSGKGEALAEGTRRHRRDRLEPVERRSAAAGRRRDGELGPHRRAGQQRRPRPTGADPRDLTDEDWHQGMEVYFLNVVRPTRLVTPIMQQQSAGVIINISTFAAFEPDPVFPTSGVFRAGLAAFTKLFADKYAAENIRMNNVLPGFIDSLPENADSAARIPMQRYGKTEEMSA